MVGLVFVVCLFGVFLAVSGARESPGQRSNPNCRCNLCPSCGNAISFTCHKGFLLRLHCDRFRRWPLFGFVCLFALFCFWPHLQPVEVPGSGVKHELQLWPAPWLRRRQILNQLHHRELPDAPCFDDLDSFEENVPESLHVAECASIFVCLMFLSWLHWSCGLLRGGPWRYSSSLVMSFQGTCCQQDTTDDVTFLLLAGWGSFARFFHCKSPHPPISSCSTLWKEVAMQSHTYGARSFAPSPWRRSTYLNHAEFCTSGRFASSPLSIHSCIYISMDSDVYFIIRVVIQYCLILVLELFPFWLLGTFSVGSYILSSSFGFFVFLVFCFCFFLSFCYFFGPLSRHMEVLRLGVE